MAGDFGVGGKVEGFHGLGGACPHGIGIQAEVAQAKANLFPRGGAKDLVIGVLEDIAYRERQPRDRSRRGILPGDRDAAGSGPQQSV